MYFIPVMHLQHLISIYLRLSLVPRFKPVKGKFALNKSFKLQKQNFKKLFSQNIRKRDKSNFFKMSFLVHSLSVCLFCDNIPNSKFSHNKNV